LAIQKLNLLSTIATTVKRLDDRNGKAQDIIRSYARRHAGMDIAIGIIGLLPGAAIPAIIAAISAQSPLIYQPMARDLAAIYTIGEGELDQETSNVRRLVMRGAVETGIIDIGAEFGTEFLMHIGKELVSEVGLGVLASLCVPALGGVVGAALDYLIANMMTWRVGTMVSIYYQNGGSWVGSKDSTFKAASRMTGGIRTSVTELLDKKKRQEGVRVDLGSIRWNVPQVRDALLAPVKNMVEMMREAMSNDQIRSRYWRKEFPSI